MERAPVNLRNLERIEEATTSGKTRAWTVALAVVGSAAVVSASMAMSRPESPRIREKSDESLAELVRTSQQGGSGKAPTPPEVKVSELGYPSLLSDQDQPTTALVAVKDARGDLVPQADTPEADPPLAPPEALDRLPVVPLPVGTLMHQTSVTAEPKDELLRIAVAKSEPTAETPEPGATDLLAAGTPSEEGFALQLASFKNQAEADKLVDELRRRRHPAYRQAANVPERGLWHRVRIGPFKTKYAAELYKKNLSDDERISALLIDPEKAERADKVRAERLAERIRKFGAP